MVTLADGGIRPPPWRIFRQQVEASCSALPSHAPMALVRLKSPEIFNQ
jgi:hypothetical protein